MFWKLLFNVAIVSQMDSDHFVPVSVLANFNQVSILIVAIF